MYTKTSSATLPQLVWIGLFLAACAVLLQVSVRESLAAVQSPFVLTVESMCVGDNAHVRLIWNDPGNAKRYVVHRSTNMTTGWRQIASQATTSRTYTDRKVEEQTTYYYQLQALGTKPSRHTDIRTVVTRQCPTVGTIPSPKPSTTATTTVSTKPTTPSTPTTPTPTSGSASSKLLWGMYAGWADSDVTTFEKTVGKSPDMVAYFTHWGGNSWFPVEMTKHTKDKGRTLVIFWEASGYDTGNIRQPKYSYEAILRGDFNAYFTKFAADAKKFGGPVILIPFSEMNGDWSPWGGTVNGNTPEKAVSAYQHVRGFFRDVPNVKFGWAPNSDSVPDTYANRVTAYYPGDAYVDYVGVDGFNFASPDPWLSFNQIFGTVLTDLSAYKKPIYIFSFASAPGSAKAAWMTDAFQVQMKKYPLLTGWVWFNQNKERDWRVWSDSASLAAFQKAVGL